MESIIPWDLTADTTLYAQWIQAVRVVPYNGRKRAKPIEAHVVAIKAEYSSKHGSSYNACTYAS
jgi:hypothetical protein